MSYNWDWINVTEYFYHAKVERFIASFLESKERNQFLIDSMKPAS